VSDLAARLRAVVEERVAVAREAAHGTAAEWFTYERYILAADPSPSMDPEVEPVLYLAMDGTQSMMDHIALNDPADVILACERDLAVLERHAPETALAGEMCCGWCREPVPDERGVDEACRVPWPCDEIRDLSTRYRVEVDGG